MNDDLHLEMAYISYEDSCKDPHVDPDGTLRECRRGRWHKYEGTPHASDYPLTVWRNE